MKKLAWFMVILLLAGLVLSGCVSAEKKTVAGNVDRIMIYTSMYQDVIITVQNALNRYFPHSFIDFAYGGTGALQNRVAAELAAGTLGCDMLMVGEPGYSLELKENGLLHSYKSREIPSLAMDYDPDGYWYPVRISNMVLAYNPEKYSKNSLPHSFQDFAHDPQVTGAISMGNPLTSGTSMASVTALRDKFGYSYFDALGKQGVVVESSAVAITKLEAGQYKMIMVLEESILSERQLNKSKLEVIYPTDGVIMIPSTIMTIAERFSPNKNTKTAEAITDWFLNTEGQNAIVDGWMHSVRVNFLKHPYDSISIDQIRPGSIPVNWDNYFRQRDEIRQRFEEYTTSRVF